MRVEYPLEGTPEEEAGQDGGYAALGFKNQGQCVKTANQAS